MRHTLKPGVILLLALAASGSLAAEEKDAALCAFVKRVLAERPSEFAAFKGAPAKDDAYNMSFAGTAAPNDMKCSLHVRRKIGKQVLTPSYDCARFDLNTEGAKKLYVEHTTTLKACLPGAQITEAGPNAASEITTWRWIAKTADYEVEVDASNGNAMLVALFKGQPITDEVKNSMTVGINVTDLSPTPPGAKLPEQP